MARASAAERTAQRIRETYEGSFGDFTVQQLEDEIIRQLKLKRDHEENKKAQNTSYNELIKEAKEAIVYCVERIDYLRHEEAVEAHLENEEAA